MAKKTGLGRGLDALFADAMPIEPGEAAVEATEETEAKAPKSTKASASKAGSKTGAKTAAKSGSKASGKASGSKTEAKAAVKADSKAEGSTADEDRIIYVDINDIKPNSAQPRKKFDEEKLQELADSIKANGLIQPVIVRDSTNGYELVAGERRWRASRLIGLKMIPCIVRNFDEQQNAIVAIIENMQREDLDAIEEAAGLQAMTKKYGFTQEQVSASVGKSRAYITNSIRLLKLPQEIQDCISDGRISAAHGRTLINIADEKKQIELCNKIVKEGLSVRATEKLADKAKDEATPARKKRKTSGKGEKSSEILAVEEELRTLTGTKVNITGDGKVGKLELEYYSLEELNRLIEAIRRGF